MLTNKDIRVENGNLVLNGDKYPLDGQSPEAIMEIVEDNSDTTPTENSTAPITSGGVYTALGTKQDTLTFDTAPTDASTNPVTSAGIKTYVDNATNFSTETGTNASLQRFGKLRILNSNRCTYADLKTFYSGLPSTDKPSTLRFNIMIRTSNDNKYMTTPFVYVGSTTLVAMHFSAYNADGVEGQIGDTDRLIGEIVYTVD